MNEADALDIVQAALWTVIAASGPAILAAMVAGVVIALFQALTQVQEMTLTFVPKVIVVVGVCITLGGWMLSVATELAIRMFEAAGRM